MKIQTGTNIDMIILGLSGKKLAGKDSFFRALEKVSHVEVRRLALADPLKDEVYKYVLKPFNIEREALDDDRKKYFRLILQGWGTDFRRNFFGSDYWVRCLEKRLTSKEFKNFTGIVVITDIRFEDEAQFVKESDGMLIRIERPAEQWWERVKQSLGFVKDKHPSECALDNYKHFDHRIYNDKELADLETEASILLEKLSDKYHI